MCIRQLLCEMFRPGSGLRRGVLGKVLGVALVCTTLVLAPSPRPALAAASPITLGTHSFGRVLVDSATSQIFISSPGDNSIAVLDLTGNILTTITGESGANAMAVVGTTLYVSLQTTGSIDIIDTASRTKTGTLVSGLVQPGDLAYAGGK